MANSRSLTRNQNHDHSSSRKKRSKTFDKGVVASWSDLKDDVLLLVMMQLGFVDYYAFSGVCKSWRSLALSNRNRFMASKPPMGIWRNDYFYLEDFEERRFNTLIPHSANKICYGVTCGYIIMIGKETYDFLLVNSITRHQLHFPNWHLLVGAHEVCIRAILVYSPSTSGWVFVVLHRLSRYRRCKQKISFYIEGKRGWNHVSSRDTLHIDDLHFFKGKIYTLYNDCSVGELRLYLNRERKWTLLKAKNFPEQKLSYPELVSSGENLYLISRHSNPEKVMELDIGEMKWVLPNQTIEEYAFFISNHNKSSAVMKLESWAGPQTRLELESFAYLVDDDKCMFCYYRMWYCPHDCFSVNILDE